MLNEKINHALFYLGINAAAAMALFTFTSETHWFPFFMIYWIGQCSIIFSGNFDPNPKDEN